MTSETSKGVKGIDNPTGHHHKARARAEAEAFEQSLLAKLTDPVEQGLARVATTMYFTVRLYHWRRMSRARRRDKEAAEAVAAGNALERLLERLRFLPPSADDAQAPQHRPAHSDLSAPKARQP